MKDFTPHDFAALIGIDWADQKHDICEQPAGNKPRRLTVITSRPEAIHDWAIELKQRYPDQPVNACSRVSTGWIRTLNNAMANSLTANSLTACRGRGPSWRHACWWLLGPTGTAIKPRPNSKSMPGWRR